MQEANRIAALAAKLATIKRRDLARQFDIEAATCVDQTVISRVLHGKKKRMTPQLERLDRYADMLLEPRSLPQNVQQAAMEFLIFGTAEELVAAIELAKKLVARAAP